MDQNTETPHLLDQETPSLEKVLEQIKNTVSLKIATEIELAKTHPELYRPNRDSELTFKSDDVERKQRVRTVVKERLAVAHNNKQQLAIEFSSDLNSQFLLSFTTEPFSWQTIQILIKGKVIPLDISFSNDKITLSKRDTLDIATLTEIISILTETNNPENPEKQKQKELEYKLEDRRYFTAQKIGIEYEFQTLKEDPKHIQDIFSHLSEVEATRLMTDAEAANKFTVLNLLYESYSSRPLTETIYGRESEYTTEVDFDFYDEQFNPQALVLVETQHFDKTTLRMKLGILPLVQNGQRVGWASLVQTELSGSDKPLTQVKLLLGNTTLDRITKVLAQKLSERAERKNQDV